MKVIIAGPRTIKDRDLVFKVYKGSYIEMTELVCGMAAGVDKTAYYIFKEELGFPCKEFPADWKNLKVEGAIPKRHPIFGVYNVTAGSIRNKKMAEYADALLAIWDGKSRGTKDMISIAKKLGLLVVVYRTDKDQYFRYNDEDKILLKLF